MRRSSLVIALVVVGCRNEAPTVRADVPAPLAHVAKDLTEAKGQLANLLPEVVIEAAPPPTHTVSRARFSAVELNKADHGIDGSFELWRDKRLDDATVAANWFHAFADAPPTGFEGLFTAQLILRDEHGGIVESLDLENPLAKLESIRLGDDLVPYLEVAIDTYHGASRWGGTTHRFARVEAGHTKWLECARSYHFAMAGMFWFDPRPSGGNDIVAYEQDMGASTTTLRRIQVEAGTCRAFSKSVSGWLGDWGGPPPPATADFPPRL